MPDKKPEFEPQDKKLKLDVHKVLISTGFSDVRDQYFIEVKSQNNPLFKGRQYMEDSDDVDMIFRNLRKKDDIYDFIGGIYKEADALSLSKVFADEKRVRDEAKAKEMADQMAADQEVPPPADAPADEEPAEENVDDSRKPETIPGFFPRATQFNQLFAETKDKLKYK
jgi:hypothetical protein